METPSFGSSFAAVDLSGTPDALREYLDRVRRIPSVSAAKRVSFELMEIAPAQHVLDLGCGTGEDACELGRLVGDGGLIVGVDKSEVLLAEARRRLPHAKDPIEFVRADANALPFPAASFDRCRSDRTIQHVPDADEALVELFRVTKPGGLVVLSEVWNVLDFGGAEPGRVALEILRRRWSANERRGWIGFLLPLLLTRAGFTAVEVLRSSVEATSFDEAALVLGLQELCDAAVRAGALSPGSVRDWLTRLEADFVTGRASLRSDFIHLKGRKSAAKTSID